MMLIIILNLACRKNGEKFLSTFLPQRADMWPIRLASKFTKNIPVTKNVYILQVAGHFLSVLQT